MYGGTAVGVQRRYSVGVRQGATVYGRTASVRQGGHSVQQVYNVRTVYNGLAQCTAGVQQCTAVYNSVRQCTVYGVVQRRYGLSVY